MTTETNHQVPGSVDREDVGDGVTRLQLNRPGRANAWGPDMAADLLRQLGATAADPSVRACLLTGAGDKAFSSGADIGNQNAHRTLSVGDFLAEEDLAGHTLFDTLARFPKPLICAVNGLAIGAGCIIALHCDVVIAADHASFAMPQVRLGVLPAYGGLFRLAQWVGRGRAMEIGLSGRRVPAQEAAQIGLVARVCPRAELASVAEAVGRSFAELPPLAVRLVKDSLDMAFENAGGRTAARADMYRFAMLGLTEDSIEAHAAWREKRAPIFGRR